MASGRRRTRGHPLGLDRAGRRHPHALLPGPAEKDPPPRFLAYDISADAWNKLPAPPRSAYSIASVGDLLIASRQYTRRGVDDWSWDPAAQVWRDLPDSPDMPWDLRQFVDVDGTGILVGQARVEGSKRNQGYLTALRLDPKTRTWAELSSPAKEDRPSVVGAPWYAVDGLAVSASTHGDRLGDSGQLGGFLHPHDGWSPLPPRPRELDSPDEHLPWAEAAGDGYVVAGRFALHVPTRTWQEVPVLPELSGLGGEPAVAWAGDHLFVWGGQQDPKAPTDQGWAWRAKA